MTFGNQPKICNRLWVRQKTDPRSPFHVYNALLGKCTSPDVYILKRDLSEGSRQEIVESDGNPSSRNFRKIVLSETALQTMSIVSTRKRARAV
jgi:hypothetical protein